MFSSSLPRQALSFSASPVQQCCERLLAVWQLAILLASNSLKAIAPKALMAAIACCFFINLGYAQSNPPTQGGAPIAEVAAVQNGNTATAIQAPPTDTNVYEVISADFSLLNSLGWIVIGLSVFTGACVYAYFHKRYIPGDAKWGLRATLVASLVLSLVATATLGEEAAACFNKTSAPQSSATAYDQSCEDERQSAVSVGVGLVLTPINPWARISSIFSTYAMRVVFTTSVVLSALLIFWLGRPVVRSILNRQAKS
jgi:hypothetical protein